jgi:RecA/RadA recombinase
MSHELSELEKSLLTNINKKFGKENPMEQLTEDSLYGKPRGWIDTGIYSLNWLISGELKNGYPVGRITEFDGDPSTGKSLLCEMAIKDPNLGIVIYFDTESALNRDFLKFLGIAPERIMYQPIDTIEQLIQAMNEVLTTIIANKSDKRVLIIIDSIAMASTTKEMNPEGGQDMGYKAREIRKFFRVYSRKIEKHNIAVLVTNHYTATIGNMYGPKKVTTGGTGLRYAASVAVDLKVQELTIDKKIESLGASSVTIRASSTKNRCFSPRRKIDFILDFERGVNRYSGLLKILLDYKICEKNGGWYNFIGEEEKFYAKDFSKIVEGKNLLETIQEKLNSAVKSIATEETNNEIESDVIDELEERENTDGEDFDNEEVAPKKKKRRK